MRFSYKTVHFDLQKEGLLGNAFLDESEVERSLNEYGKAGWELVSILETQEGLLAVFKQPIAIGRAADLLAEETDEPRLVSRSESRPEARLPETFTEMPELEHDRMGVVPVEDYEIVAEEGHQEPKEQEGQSENDIGAIRIE